MWGALVGVFATPLMLLGYWQIYHGLSGANEVLRLITIFVFWNGFSYRRICAWLVLSIPGEYVKALNGGREDSQTGYRGTDREKSKVIDDQLFARSCPVFHCVDFCSH